MPTSEVEHLPRVFASGQHPIKRALISRHAIDVLEELIRHGYEAYLVGGSIRDMYLSIQPKDFDIVTNALPEEILACFKNCRLIGKRFRLAHVRFGRELIEVATFRGAAESDHHDHRIDEQTGMVVRDNVYGCLEDDVFRRDFTVNALYYHYADDSVIDYVSGVDDLEKKQLRMIGEPKQRYYEDPVRMLRAIRHTCKLNLTLSPDCEQAIAPHSDILRHIAPARLFEEYTKLFLKGAAKVTFTRLQHYDLFRHLFPACYEYLTEQQDETLARLITFALENTDVRVQEEKPINPAFLVAVFLWPAYQDTLAFELAQSQPYRQAAYSAYIRVLKQQAQTLSIPKRLALTIRDMWELQNKLTRRQKKHIHRVLSHEKFRAGYDLLVLRAKASPENRALSELADWWTTIQATDETNKKAMIDALRRPTEH